MKSLIKVAGLMCFSAVVLHLMNRQGLLRFDDVAAAFRSGGRWVTLAIVMQLGVSIGMLFRYQLLVRLFGIEVRFPQVAAATFVSNAVGQWAPGSMAVIELIRVGLMLGADRHARTGVVGSVDPGAPGAMGAMGAMGAQERTRTTGREATPEVRSLSARLAVASLFDRLVGFFSILTVGAFASCAILFKGTGPDSAAAGVHFGALLSLAAFSVLGALGIGALPWIARWSFPEQVLARLHDGCARAKTGRSGMGHSVLAACERLFWQLQAARRAIASGSERPVGLVRPVLVSCASFGMACLALYFSAKAIGSEIGLGAIVATYPIIAIASLLPIGFGGMGGYQLVAVAAFGMFGLSPASVSSASLLQNGLLLLQNTLLGLLCAQLSASSIRAILRARDPAAAS